MFESVCSSRQSAAGMVAAVALAILSGRCDAQSPAQAPPGILVDTAPFPRSLPANGTPVVPIPDARVPVPPPPTPGVTAAPGPLLVSKVMTIDLAYALRQVDAGNPTIALARERVNEAYARQQQAAVLWVPNAFLGGNPDAPGFLPTFYHHDGMIQNAKGDVFDTVKSNFALESGVSLNVNLTDAIFAPRIARQATAAATARARTVDDNVQLDVALAYLDLLRAFGALAINAETIHMAELMLRFAEESERNGLGKTSADANRARTELDGRKRERIDLEGQAAVASARLTKLLLLDPTLDLVPVDRAVVPISLVNTDVDVGELIAVGLLNRPELAESRALVRQALTEWRANKLRPLIPTLYVTYYTNSFQGGDPGFHDTGYRDDLLAQAGWELHNGGFGDLFRARESRARYNESIFHVQEVQAQVGAEVAAAAKLTLARQRTVLVAQDAVRQAEEMWSRLSKAAFGLAAGARHYDPLEPLLAEQQLDQARMAYLDEVISFNRNQFRLYWAMGQPPLSALPRAVEMPVRTPVLPAPSSPGNASGQPAGGGAPALPRSIRP